jgi:hypothetical protein
MRYEAVSWALEPASGAAHVAEADVGEACDRAVASSLFEQLDKSRAPIAMPVVEIRMF